MEIIILLLSFCLDFAFGDPVYQLHPVRLIGRWIRFAEKIFLKQNFTNIISGIIFWFIIVIPVVIFYLLVTYFLVRMNLTLMNIFWQSYVVYSCFAFRDMIEHTNPVTQNLEKNNLAKARMALKKIVGRDVEKLGKTGIIKASIESLSESFVDGYFSPVFLYVLGCTMGGNNFENNIVTGVVLVIIFRCANTLDSMVGYRSEKYEKFGKFSARIDDVLNFFPARISIFLMLPGIFLAGGNIWSSIVCFLKDRLKSASPNAAHPMSAFAGALEISLGGTAVYGGYTLEKPVLGLIAGDINLTHLKKAMRIFIISGFFTILAAIILLHLNSLI